MTKFFNLAFVAAFALLAGIVSSSFDAPALADSAPAPVVQITIDPQTILAPVTDLSFGINTSVYDAHLMDPVVSGLIRQAGFTVMRYPGGSTSDEYHWQSNSYTPQTKNGKPGSVASSNDFDHFIQLAHASGAEPIVTVNYGSNSARTGGGDPDEAAAWVAYAKQKRDHVQYWEVGNEIYGNGFYGADWETDLHAPKDGVPESSRKNNPLLGPTAYGKNVAAFVRAMKAKDAGIKIGAVLTAPGNWPDGVAPDWNSHVLLECGRDIDFAIIHVYPQNPGGESDVQLLGAPSKNAATIAALRPLLQQYCGRQIPIFVTEANSVSSNPGKQSVSQVNALFAADDVLSWIEAGAANVDWWQLHNGPTTNANNSPQLFGDASFGDYGVLMNGDSPEPVANRPQRSYFGFAMLHLFAESGDCLVRASSDSSDLAVYATTAMHGRQCDLLLINKSSTHTIRVSLRDFPPQEAWDQEDYLYGPDSIAPGAPPLGSALQASGLLVPPYTMILLKLHKVSRNAN